jgi:hypothetical protein
MMYLQNSMAISEFTDEVSISAAELGNPQNIGVAIEIVQISMSSAEL